MWKSFIRIVAIFILPACSSLPRDSSSSPVATQPSLATATKRSEESLIATEQARAAAVKTELALTIVAQPTLTPWSTPTSSFAHLPTLTPIPNSTPAGLGAFLDISPDVLGSKYEIQNAYYFDSLDGRERYEIYAGAIAGFSDVDTAQGVAVVRILRVIERDKHPYVEVVGQSEFLTTNKHYDVFPVGPVRIDNELVPESENGHLLLVSISQGFSWIFLPTEGYLRINSVPPRAVLEIDEKTQLAGVGSYCWIGSCADGGAISTSSIPLSIQSLSNAHLHLPLVATPDKLVLSAILVSPPGVLQVDAQYDSLQKDHISWFYGKPGREVQDLGALSLKREQEIELSLEPGYYVFLVFAYWQIYGDVTYGFLVEVKE